MKPIYTHDCNNCIYLSTEINSERNNTLSDIYFCKGVLGFNILVRDGNNGEDYSSGIDFCYRDSIREFLNKGGEPTIREVGLNLAIDKGYLSKSIFYIGYSEKKNKEVEEKYYNSNYYKNRPKLDCDYNDMKSFEEKTKNQIKKQEEYDLRYKQEEKIIPEDPCKYHFIFKTEKEMNSYCEKDESAIINAVNEEHANILYHSLSIMDKVMDKLKKQYNKKKSL
jgi:hypothetical protein